MATLGEAAKDYKSSQTMNIADLDKVSTDMQLADDEFEFTDKVTGVTKTIKQEVVVLDEVKYRVPVSVKKQLQIILKDNPETKFFKVKKSGVGIENTTYQVIPLME
jgi:hypothetical protein